MLAVDLQSELHVSHIYEYKLPNADLREAGAPVLSVDPPVNQGLGGAAIRILQPPE
jgi:hypothetical protein